MVVRREVLAKLGSIDRLMPWPPTATAIAGAAMDATMTSTTQTATDFSRREGFIWRDVRGPGCWPQEGTFVTAGPASLCGGTRPDPLFASHSVFVLRQVPLVVSAAALLTSPLAAQRVGPVFVDGQAQVVPAFADSTSWVRERLWVETSF